MSERRWRACGLAVLIAAAVSPRTGVAQARGAAGAAVASPVAPATVPGSGLALARAAFERRVAQLTDSATRLDARLAILEAEARVVARDTVRDGAFVVATTPEYLRAVRTALAVAAPAARARWGERPVARTFDATVTRVMTVSESRLGSPVARTYATVLRGDRAERERRLDPIDGDTASAIATFLAEATGEMMQERLDTALTRWLGRARITEGSSGLDRAFVDMVTAPALVARQCAAGDIARCLEALQLAPPAGNPRTTWYSLDDQRAVARAWWAGRRRSAEQAALENPCASTPMSDACRAFADSLPASTWEHPLSADARGTLLAVAGDLGGTTAWARLLEDPMAPLARRIEGAAARPLAEVVSAWRERVLQSRPAPVRPRTSALASATLLALAAFATVAARRERA